MALAAAAAAATIQPGRLGQKRKKKGKGRDGDISALARSDALRNHTQHLSCKHAFCPSNSDRQTDRLCSVWV